MFHRWPKNKKTCCETYEVRWFCRLPKLLLTEIIFHVLSILKGVCIHYSIYIQVRDLCYCSSTSLLDVLQKHIHELVRHLINIFEWTQRLVVSFPTLQTDFTVDWIHWCQLEPHPELELTFQDMLDQSPMPINKDQNSEIDPNVDQ